jgi:hypothetical protein
LANVLGFFKAATPWLAAGLRVAGGPVGNVAASILTSVTGQDVKPENVEQVMASLAKTDEGRLKLIEADHQFEAAMRKMNFDHLDKVLELENADRDSARQREMAVRDKTPMYLALGIVAMAATLAIAVAISFFSGTPKVVDVTLAGMLGTVIGYVFGEMKAVSSYYFGSSAGSAATTDLLAKADAIKEQK